MRGNERPGRAAYGDITRKGEGERERDVKGGKNTEGQV